MKKITPIEYIQLVESNPYCGYYSCFAGKPPRYGAPVVVALVTGELYLFGPEEIGTKEWVSLIDKHIEELVAFDRKDSNV